MTDANEWLRLNSQYKAFSCETVEKKIYYRSHGRSRDLLPAKRIKEFEVGCPPIPSAFITASAAGG